MENRFQENPKLGTLRQILKMEEIKIPCQERVPYSNQIDPRLTPGMQKKKSKIVDLIPIPIDKISKEFSKDFQKSYFAGWKPFDEDIYRRKKYRYDFNFKKSTCDSLDASYATIRDIYMEEDLLEIEKFTTLKDYSPMQTQKIPIFKNKNIENDVENESVPNTPLLRPQTNEPILTQPTPNSASFYSKLLNSTDPHLACIQGGISIFFFTL